VIFVTLPADVESVAGAQELHRWFGYWPDFHDAEVVKFHLSLGAPSTLVVHTWEMTNEVDAAGFYKLIKHVIVEFTLGCVSSLNLQDPWEHSILLHLGINKTDAGFRLDLSSAYGLCGTIEAKELSLQITPSRQTA
jgi:immunity protein 50 of polymorphic toxin system